MATGTVNLFRVTYFSAQNVSGDYYFGTWTAISSPLGLLTPGVNFGYRYTNDGGYWLITRAGQPSEVTLPDGFAGSVSISSYYDAETNITEVPYYASLGLPSGPLSSSPRSNSSNNSNNNSNNNSSSRRHIRRSRTSRPS